MSRSDRQRLYASLLALGACILLALTVIMMGGGALTLLTAWVGALLIAEFLVDAATLAASVRWWVTRSSRHASVALRLGASAAILHAARVLIFAMGRVGPWLDFDVRPEHRLGHAARWTWGQVYFASTLSILGVLGVLLIWWWRRRARAR